MRCQFPIVHGWKTALSNPYKSNGSEDRQADPLCRAWIIFYGFDLMDSMRSLLMRCNFPTVYGWKTAFSIGTNRTDRQAVSPPCLWLDLNYILSPLNQMQFSDRIQIENNLLLTVKQYRSKSCFIGPYQCLLDNPGEGGGGGRRREEERTRLIQLP